MEALHVAHRTDLIGFGEKCLIRPRKLKQETAKGGRKARAVSGYGRGNPNKQGGQNGNKQVIKGSGASKKAGNGAPKSKKKKKTIRNVHKK